MVVCVAVSAFWLEVTGCAERDMFDVMLVCMAVVTGAEGEREGKNDVEEKGGGEGSGEEEEG